MKKRLFVILLSISLTVISLFGLAACGDAKGTVITPTKSELAGEPPKEYTVQELQQQIAELQKEINSLSERVNNLEKENKYINERLKQLNEQNRALSKRLSELEQAKATGQFYTLQEAYNNGWLSKTDLTDIACYHHRTVKWASEYIPEGYVPTPKIPLSEQTETAIKQSYIDIYCKPNNHYALLEDIFIGEDYYGTYNNCVAVMVWDANSGYDCAIGDIYVGSVRFLYPDGNRITVWVSNDVTPVVTDVLTSLDVEKATEIKTTYYNNFNLEEKQIFGDNYAYTAEDLSLRCFGEYNGAYVMFIDIPFAIYIEHATRIEIDGVVFYFGNSQPLYVYNNGSFNSLWWAFDNGLLTHDDLLEIVYRMGNRLFTTA